LRNYHAIPETIGCGERYKTKALVFATGADRTGSKLGEELLRCIVLRSLGDIRGYEGKEYKKTAYRITDGVYCALGVKLISLSGFIYLDGLDVS
jgi:hypothetical protein